MPIFGDSSSPYDECVEKVTAETITTENWALMMDICDRVNAEGTRGCKQCLLSVKKRMNHRDPHVVLLGLSLLDCLWNNCSQHFRREVSSKEFIGELSYKCTNSNRVIAEKARSLVKKWVQSECKQDSSLSLVESLYKELMEQGYDFDADPSAQKKTVQVLNDPNVVHSEQEEADIAKAIALSLQENGGGKGLLQSAYPTLANNNNNNDSGSMAKNGYKEKAIKQVRALYDFEAVEDNEISFLAGEIISVFDDSDQNWWRGSTSRNGTAGLFPASFVTSDLSESVQGPAEENDDKATELDAELVSPPKVQIDEGVLLKCIEMIEGLDPMADAFSEPSDLPYLENMAMAQAPLINQKLEQIDKQLDTLAEVDLAIRDVLAAYDNAVQKVVATSASSFAPTANSSTACQPQQAQSTGPVNMGAHLMHDQQQQNMPSAQPPPLPQQHEMSAHWQN